MAKIKIKQDLSGVKILKKLASELSAKASKVGFLDSGEHPGASDGSTVAGIAYINHFGHQDEHAPARPFMPRDSDKKTYLPALQAGAKELMSLKGSPTTSLGLTGTIASTILQDVIWDVVSPANRPSTIRGKSGSNPLIDSKTMVEAVTHRVGKPE